MLSCITQYIQDMTAIAIFRLPEEMHQKLVKIAEERFEGNDSMLIRAAIREYIEKYKKTDE